MSSSNSNNYAAYSGIALAVGGIAAIASYVYSSYQKQNNHYNNGYRNRENHRFRKTERIRLIQQEEEQRERLRVLLEQRERLRLELEAQEEEERQREAQIRESDRLREEFLISEQEGLPRMDAALDNYFEDS